MTVKEANEAIWYEKPVIYSGIEYTITALIKRKHHREPRFHYIAELKDKKAYSSLVYADLDRVHLKGETDIEKS